MDSFFDEIDSTLLLLLFLATLAQGESDMIEEIAALEETKKLEESVSSVENEPLEEKPEEGLEADMPEPELQKEGSCYIHRSSNRKRLKPRAVYF